MQIRFLVWDQVLHWISPQRCYLSEYYTLTLNKPVDTILNVTLHWIVWIDIFLCDMRMVSAMAFYLFYAAFLKHYMFFFYFVIFRYFKRRYWLKTVCLSLKINSPLDLHVFVNLYSSCHHGVATVNVHGCCYGYCY